jgi:hypothetical protein
MYADVIQPGRISHGNALLIGLGDPPERRTSLSIEVSPELTEAMLNASRSSVRLREAAISPDREEHRRALKEWLAAQQRRREVWLTMSSPVPTS